MFLQLQHMTMTGHLGRVDGEPNLLVVHVNKDPPDGRAMRCSRLARCDRAAHFADAVLPLEPAAAARSRTLKCIKPRTDAPAHGKGLAPRGVELGEAAFADARGDCAVDRRLDRVECRRLVNRRA